MNDQGTQDREAVTLRVMGETNRHLERIDGKLGRLGRIGAFLERHSSYLKRIARSLEELSDVPLTTSREVR